MHMARRGFATSTYAALALGVTLLFGAAPTALAQQDSAMQDVEQVKLDVPYVPTPNDAVHRMLEMAGVQPDDYLIDLGSGDGRIVIQAVRDWGVREAIGVEIDPERIAEANANAREAGVEDRVSFEQGDLFEKDFSKASVLTMYLLESINLDLRPVILETLKPGTRVVSHVFSMGDWQPDDMVTVRSLNAYLWIVPARVGGNWRIDLPDGDGFTVMFAQSFQNIDGTAIIGGHNIPMTFARLRGDEVRFSANGQHFIGKVDGDTITAVSGPGTVEGWHAKRL